jgi:hypothetical protein
MFATDISQMDTDKKRLNLRVSDFHLWRFFFLALFFALIAPSRLSLADAVGVPFYYASSTVFDQQVSTIILGVNDVVGQGIVSGDRKYVTLNMDANLLSAPGVRTFTYQKSTMGFVGSGSGGISTPAIAGAPAERGALTPSIAANPSEIAPQVSILDKPGMVLVAPLTR